MTLGAEPKKLIVLGALLAVAAVVFIFNSSGSGGEQSSSYTPPPAARGTSPIPAASPGAPRDRAAATRQTRVRGGQEFRPSLKPKRGEERPDPMTIDPTLKLDTLAKLQTVNVEGTRRSIFDFSQPAAAKPDPAKIVAAKPVPSPIVPIKAPEAAQAAAPVTPQAPPIPLKFYGYVNAAGQPLKRAFFVEGEDIHVVTEGELVRKRYKIVRIGVNSVVVEDTQFGSQQTLPLEEQQG